MPQQEHKSSRKRLEECTEAELHTAINEAAQMLAGLAIYHKAAEVIDNGEQTARDLLAGTERAMRKQKRIIDRASRELSRREGTKEQLPF